jgi:hypothetical protein
VIWYGLRLSSLIRIMCRFQPNSALANYFVQTALKFTRKLIVLFIDLCKIKSTFESHISRIVDKVAVNNIQNKQTRQYREKVVNYTKIVHYNILCNSQICTCKTGNLNFRKRFI